MRIKAILSLCLFTLATAVSADEFIKINTDQVGLVLRAADNGRLYQSYLGKRLANESDLQHLPKGNEAYLTHGMEDYFEPAIEVHHNDANPSLLLKYVSHTSKNVQPGVDETVITLQDDKYPVTVKLHYVAYAKENIIKTFTEISHQEKKPLFLYLAYNAPHFPLHAPKEVTDKYMSLYMQGWDKIRDARWKRIVDLKLMQGKPALSPRGVVPESLFEDETHPLPAWDSLTKDQQTDLARRMSIFAAMVDVMDANIGRVVDELKKNGELDNTFIMFMSDNGACAEWHEFGFDKQTGTEYHTHVGAELDQMGLPGTYHHYGTGWANVCCTPFTLYKHYAHEGGISTPCIIQWGKQIKHKGSIDHQPAQFSDIMATCIELAGTKYPEEYEGRKIVPTPGKSILPIVRGEEMPDRYIYAEHEGNRMVRKGDWKLVSANFRGDEWELYNIKEDRTEQHNLIKEYPEMAKELEDAYFEWADHSDVLYFPKVWNTYNKGRRKDFKEYRDK